MFLYFSDDPLPFSSRKEHSATRRYSCVLRKHPSVTALCLQLIISAFEYRYRDFISHYCLEKQLALSRDKKCDDRYYNNEIEMLYYLTVNDRHSDFQYCLTTYNIGNIVNSMMEKK